MNDKIISLGQASAAKAAVQEDPNYHYTITLKDGTPVDAVGYLLINSIFVGVAQGEGILQYAIPLSDFASVVNHGPVSAVAN